MDNQKKQFKQWEASEVSKRISATEMFAINHGFEEWNKPTVADFWLSKRKEELQEIREQIEEFLSGAASSNKTQVRAIFNKFFNENEGNER